MSDYNATYKGRVVNNADPLGIHRLILQVASITGPNTTTWALPGDPNVYSSPKVGATVYVTFHDGNLSLPLWWGNAELAIPSQTEQILTQADTNANTYTDSAVSSSLTANTGQTTLWKSTNVVYSMSSTTWNSTIWDSSDTTHWPSGSMLPSSATHQVTPTFNGIFLYTFKMSFVGGYTGASNIGGLRCVTQGGTIVGANSFDPSLLLDPVHSLTVMVDQVAGYYIYFQWIVGGTGSYTIDTQYPHGISLSIALIKRY